MKERNVSIIKDLNGKELVIVNDIVFYGKQHIAWREVEEYIKQYIDDFFIVVSEEDMIFI